MMRAGLFPGALIYLGFLILRRQPDSVYGASAGGCCVK